MIAVELLRLLVREVYLIVSAVDREIGVVEQRVGDIDKFAAILIPYHHFVIVDLEAGGLQPFLCAHILLL